MGQEIENAAGAIVGNLQVDPNAPPQIGVLLLGVLIQVVTRLITKYGPTLLAKLMAKLPLNLCDKLALKKAIRMSCPDTKTYRQHGQDVFQATVKTFPQFTQAQISAMIKEVA